MARMYSRKKGKSGSTKPIKKAASWVRYKEKEIEKLIVKLAKTGKTPSEIGISLRDSYGLNSVKALLHSKIETILKRNNLQKEIPSDLMALIKKLIAVRKHYEKNKHDMTAKRGLELTNSKVMRLVKYYKKSGRLPKDWKFDPERLKMYVE
jgi:small subunit ribosomal protein S15